MDASLRDASIEGLCKNPQTVFILRLKPNVQTNIRFTIIQILKQEINYSSAIFSDVY